MVKLKEYKTPEGYWTCDIGISVEEWSQLLNDKEIQDKDFIPVLLKFYREPGHKASCKKLEKKYGRKYQYYNSAITNFGKWVQKKLNRFEILASDDSLSYWPTAVYGISGKNEFTWIIRPELSEAIEKYLIDKLLNKYKQVVLPRGLRDKNNYEIYKWEIITRCQGKDSESVLKEHLKPKMNLIDRQYDGAAISKLLISDHDSLIDCFESLLSGEINETFPIFKDKAYQLTKDRWQYTMGDERMAAAYLACVNPQKYTFYKNDIYTYFCQYLGISAKSPGNKYEHYLQLLKPLVAAEKADEEIQNFLSIETKNMVQSDLLAAQDVLWQMQNYMKESVSIDSIYTWVPFMKEFAHKLLAYKNNRKELLNIFYGIEPTLVKAYQENGMHIDDITPFTVLGTMAVGNQARRAKFGEYYKESLKIDSPIPTDYTGFPSLHPQRVMFIYGSNKSSHTDCFWDLFEKVLNEEDIANAFNEVMKVKGVNRNVSMGLFWIAPEKYLSLDATNEAYLKEYGFKRIPSKEHIDYDFYSNLMKELTEKMTSGIVKEKSYLEFSAAAYANGGTNENSNIMDNNFYDEIVDALRDKKNVILQGAPGTGKTFAIPEIVARLCDEDIDYSDRSQIMSSFNRLIDEKRVVFTTFHQSMDYEDFVEGLKPVVNADGILEYKVEDGIFKSLCKAASIPVITNNQIELGSEPTIWKVSLAGTGENEVRTDCLKNGYIRIGWDGYGAEPDEQTTYSDGGKGIIDTFVNKMEIGDVVMSCYSNKLVDAIGIITGDYEWHEEFKHYKRVRKVKWLVKNIKEDITGINGCVMTLSTVYRLNNITVQDVLDILKKYNAAGRTTAEKNDKPYIVVIDEINRGNVSKIFGELITLLEEDKRLDGKMPLKVKLPYSKEEFSIPSNVYLLATMNTADRSLSQFDYAMRRRFRMITMSYGLIPVQETDESHFEEEIFNEVSGLFISNLEEYLNDVNVKIIPAECFSPEFNPMDLWLGQSMFIVNDNSKYDWYNKVFYEIIPTLEQYKQDGVFSDTDAVDKVIEHLKEVALAEE